MLVVLIRNGTDPDIESSLLHFAIWQANKSRDKVLSKEQWLHLESQQTEEMWLVSQRTIWPELEVRLLLTKWEGSVGSCHRLLSAGQTPERMW